MLCIIVSAHLGFPSGSAVKNPPANAGDAGDVGSIPGLGRSLGEGNGNPLPYFCLENSMNSGAWQATVHGATECEVPRVVKFIKTESKPVVSRGWGNEEWGMTV